MLDAFATFAVGFVVGFATGWYLRPSALSASQELKILQAVYETSTRVEDVDL
jgi:hypothetical protein